MANRLTLTHITFLGGAVETASVDFGSKATVIHGPSDTGKSFIVGAIDFMLGGSHPPNDIPERVGYSTALLGLRLPSGDVVTLSRSVTGGDYTLFEGDFRELPIMTPTQVLKSKHETGRDDSLSTFLLQQIGLADKRIRRNTSNQTNALTFRNLAHLCVIDETSMQSERAPAYTNVTTNNTADISTLKLLLEGVDDSSLVSVVNPAERKRKAQAREEVLERLIADLQEQLDGVADIAELRGQHQRLTQSIATYTESIGRISAERSDFNTRIVNTERQASTVRERLADIGALSARFGLLGQQYKSDLGRLEMISEAGNLLGYFNPGQCVFCGADIEHQHYNEECAEDSTAFHEAVVAEQAKTTALGADLSATLEDLQREHGQLTGTLTRMNAALDAARIRLAEYDQALAPDQGALKELLEARSTVEKSLALYDQIDRFETIRRQLINELANEKAIAAQGMQLSTVSTFSTEIAARLTAWGVPAADGTRYDRNEQDVVSGDQPRSAHGKGVRAILHSAFSLGLAEYCFNRDRPHPGFVVLDSPLVTYRPPDRGGDPGTPLPPSVIQRFYSDIQDGIQAQVIVLENIEPPEGFGPNCVDVVFTKSEDGGRYGFFPLRTASGH